MAAIKNLAAVTRSGTGKGAARSVRRDGKVPGVIYGGGDKPEPISVEFKELNKLIYAGHFLTTIFDLDIEGRKERVLPRDYQLDVVSDKPLHVDFLRLRADTGEVSDVLAAWWEDFSLVSDADREDLVRAVREELHPRGGAVRVRGAARAAADGAIAPAQPAVAVDAVADATPAEPAGDAPARKRRRRRKPSGAARGTEGGAAQADSSE